MARRGKREPADVDRGPDIARQIKLQQPERERVRVVDLARERGVHYSAILEFVRSTGEYVKSPQSYLEPPTVHAARAAFPVERETPQNPEAKPEPEETSKTGEPADTPVGLPPPAPRRRTENNPFKGVLSAFSNPRQDPWLMPARRRAATRHQPPPYQPVSHQSATPREGPGDYSPAGAHDASETMKDFDWVVRGITEVERDVWLAHGLTPYQGWIAGACIDAGIRPTDLTTNVSGTTVLNRVTRGEPAAEVARLMSRQAEAG